MNPVSIRYQDGFRIEEKTKLYPLMTSISDKIGVIYEHRVLNRDNKYLRYGLQKIKGDYYFFDVRNTVNQNIKNNELAEYICPYCREKMFIVSSFERGNSTIPIHLKHYRKTNKNCIFRTDTKSLKMREEYYNCEEFLSREMLDIVFNKLKNNELSIRIPESYKVFINKKTSEVRVEIEHRVENVHRIEKGDEYQVNTMDSYIPQLTFYTQEGSIIFCELSATKKGRNISKYYETWKNHNKTVVEIKKVDDVSLYPSKFIFEGDLSLTYLYDPILDKAKRHKILVSKKLADENRESIVEKKNMLKSLNRKKGSKKKKRALRAEVRKIVDEYLIDNNGSQILYKHITIEKDKVKIGLQVPEDLITTIKMSGYKVN